MSLYKHKKSQIWHYDFQMRGHRFHGSTGVRDKATAKSVEDKEKAKAMRVLALGDPDSPPITIHEACAIYLAERGQFEVNARDTESALRRLIADIGKTKRLDLITERDLQQIIARRRTRKVKRKEKTEIIPVANGTVNRKFTHLLRRVWRYAAPKIEQPDWSRLNLPEADERIRELSADEEARILQYMRPDLIDAVLFALETGVRKDEIINLKWRDIDRHAGVFQVEGKGIRGSGKKKRSIPISNTCARIFERNKHHVVYVFTFRQDRASHGRRMGERLPLTVTVLRRQWLKALKHAEVEDFRWHDLRHTAATRLLRKTGNLALVQQLLGHEDIATTRKYAHTTVDDLRLAMDISTPQLVKRG